MLPPPTSIEQMTDMIQILKMAIACEKRGMHMYRQVYIADNVKKLHKYYTFQNSQWVFTMWVHADD
jgi:rubrerythrin